MEIITDIDQLSDAWFKLRIGSIGGSTIAQATANGQARTTLMYRLAGEILSGKKYEGRTTPVMQMGIDLEPEARQWYEYATGNKVTQVALVRLTPHKHCSPDGLIGDGGMTQIKCVIPSTFAKVVCEDRVPPEYKKQLQWEMFISEREWNDFTCYCQPIENPIFIKRMVRDDKFIKELNADCDKFIDEMLAIVEKVRAYGT